MYETIVVGTDGSPTAGRAVAEAAQLARLCDVPLHVVSAFRPSPPGAALALAAETGMAIALTDWDLGAETAVQEQLQATALRLQAASVKVETHCMAGHPVDAIIEVAEATKADLIVVGSKGMTGARRVLGSVPNSIAHKAPCSVLVVKTG
jgi:nucleotide-binding universal stress UspA family protein